MRTSTFFDQHRERVIGLDIVRSVAILWVLLMHGGYLIPGSWKPYYYALIPLRIDGVSIFFVLSGFLIGGIIFKMMRDRPLTVRVIVNFWIRRWFRTIPAYFFVLTSVLLLKLLLKKESISFNFRYFFFSQNLWSPHPGFFGEAWSLSVEEWFYLIFPDCCLSAYLVFGNRTSPITIPIILFLVVPVILRIRDYNQSWNAEEMIVNMRNIVVYRLDAIAYGVLGAFISLRYKNQWIRYRHVLLTLGILFIYYFYFTFLSERIYHPFRYSLESLTVLCFLPFMSTLRSTGFETLDRLFVFISVISYSMYLLNYTMVEYTLIPLINGWIGIHKYHPALSTLLNYILFWFLTVSLSYLLYTFFEHPMTRLRDKFT